MNSFINALLDNVDERSEKLMEKFDKIKYMKLPLDITNTMVINKQNLECCYNCKHKPKHQFNITDILDACEDAFKDVNVLNM